MQTRSVVEATMKKVDRKSERWSFNGVHYALAIVVAALGIFGMASAGQGKGQGAIAPTDIQTAAFSGTR